MSIDIDEQIRKFESTLSELLAANEAHEALDRSNQLIDFITTNAGSVQEHCRALSLRAKVYIQCQDADKAIADLHGALNLAISAKDVDMTIEYARRLQQITKDKTGGQAVEIYINAFMIETMALIAAGEQSQALVRFGELLPLCERAMGVHHATTAAVAYAYGDCLLSQRKYADAVPILERAFNVFASANTASPTDPLLLSHISASLGTCYDKTQAFSNALSSALFAYQGYQTALGDADENTVLQCLQVGELERVRNDYPSALRWMRRALCAEERARGKESARFADISNNLGDVYHALGQLDTAQEHVTTALQIRKKLFGRQSQEYVRSLESLARITLSKQDYEKTHKLIQEQNEVVGSMGGKIDANPTELFYLIYTGRPDEAVKRAQAAIEGVPQKEKADLVLVQLHLSWSIAAAKLARWHVAIEQMKHVLELDLKALFETFEYGSRSGVRGMIEHLAWHHALFLRLLLSANSTDPELIKESFLRLQVIKGLETRILQLLKDGLINSGITEDSTLTKSQTERKKFQVELTQALMDGPKMHASEVIDDIVDKIQLMERMALMEVDPSGIATYLSMPWGATDKPESSAACIEYVRIANDFFHEPQPENTSYAAFIKLPDGALHYKELGHTSDINRAISRLQHELLDIGGSANHKSASWWRTGEFLFNKILSPFIELLAGIGHIFIAPEGELFAVPWELLPVAEDELVIDRFTTSYVWQESEVGSFNTIMGRFPDISPPIVIAAPMFSPKRDSTGKNKHRAERTMLFPPLMHAEQEGKAVATILNAKTYFGSKADRKALLSNKSPYVMHLATHSFFIPYAEHSNSTPPVERSLFALRQRLADPAERSGIAVAGADSEGAAALARPPGIVFSAEIEDFDWRGTELVTISSCQSALGDIRPGDGIHGLRRAFRAAGCKRVVSALWKVPDKATSELMMEFYTELKKGTTTAEALRIAKLAVRKKYDGHPFYWAAFILEGNNAGFRLQMPEPIRTLNLSAVESEMLLSTFALKYNEAVDLSENGEYDAALERVEQVLSSAGATADTRARSLLLRANIKARRDQFSEAIKDADKALELENIEPSLIRQIRRVRSQLNARLKDYFAVCLDLNYVLSAHDIDDEERAWCLVNLSFALMQLGRNQEMVDACTAVLKMKGAPPEQQTKALLNRIQGLKDLGLMDRALEDCNLALTRFKDPADRLKVHYSRGRLYCQTGTFHKAIVDIRTCQRILGIENQPDIDARIAEANEMIARHDSESAQNLLGFLLNTLMQASGL